MVSRGQQVRQALAGALLGVMLVPGVAAAQTRIFAGANVGVQAPATSDFSQTVSGPFRGETASQTSTYHVPPGVLLDANAGYMVGEWLGLKWLGAGLALSRATSSDNGDFSLTLPSPVAFNASVTQTGTTSEKLKHVERGVHLQAVIVPAMNNGLDVKLFIGPSKLYVNQQLVQDLEISESITPPQGYSFTINRAIIGDEKTCACAWGFHVGADVAKYFTPAIGVGGMVRYARATVKLEDAAMSAGQNTVVTQDFTAGGFMIAGGVRLRIK